MMPFIASDSALLPPDSWIIATLKDMYKTVPVFQRDVRSAGVVAAVAVGGLLASVGGGIALAVTGALTIATGLGAAVMLASSVGYAAWRGKKLWSRAQGETLPVLKEEIGKRYAAYKMEEIASAWRARRDAVRAAKNNGTAAVTPAPVAPAADAAQQPLRKAASINLSGIFGRKPASNDQATPKSAAPKAPPKP
ncbi:MAG: hypothetical protein ACRER5_02235 [Pseudomonas sp.]